MKALMSPLAKSLLADQQARRQLGQFLSMRPAESAVIEFENAGRQIKVRPTFVPKA